MRVVDCSCLFRIALSEVTAVLLEDLFLPSQARTLAEASKWLIFFFLIDIHQCCSNPPGRCLFFPSVFLLFCHSTAVLSSCASEESVADHRGFLGSTCWFSVLSSFFFLFFPDSVRVRCRRNSLVYWKSLFWPSGTTNLSPALDLEAGFTICRF